MNKVGIYPLHQIILWIDNLNTFINHYQKCHKRKKYIFGQTKAEEIYRISKELVPVLLKDDLTKLKVL